MSDLLGEIVLRTQEARFCYVIQIKDIKFLATPNQIVCLFVFKRFAFYGRSYVTLSTDKMEVTRKILGAFLIVDRPTCSFCTTRNC